MPQVVIPEAGGRPSTFALADAAKGDSNTSGTPPAKPVPDVPAMTIAQVEAVYARWLHDGTV